MKKIEIDTVHFHVDGLKKKKKKEKQTFKLFLDVLSMYFSFFRRHLVDLGLRYLFKNRALLTGVCHDELGDLCTQFTHIHLVRTLVKRNLLANNLTIAKNWLLRWVKQIE